MSKRVLRIELLAGASLLAAAVSCSSNPQTTADPFGGSTDDGGGGGGQSSGGGSSGGSSPGSSGMAGGSSSGGQSSGSVSGSGGGSSSGGTSSGAAEGGSPTDAGGGAGAPDGSIVPEQGCGQATSCTPGSDLAAPAAADGFQIVLPPGSVTMQPGQEAYYCYDKVIPGGQAVQVGAFQSWMTSGASHHFITYAGSGTDGALSGGAANTGLACNPQGNWVYATSTPGQVIELKFPAGVGLPFPANQILILNMHFINPGSAAVQPEVKLNVLYAKNVQYTAGAMVSFNSGIYVAPGATQTLTGTCTPPVGSKFFAYTTHAHKHATELDVNYVSGGVTTNIVKSPMWDSPDVALWNAPNFLTIKSGDKLTYSCAYSNVGGGTAVTLGETAATNEMCMSIGYYFPAQGASNIGSAYCN
ncbi:MAG: hypothetical protein ACRENE_21025 [Polyangiaceae bacterium]